jgi:Tol biopolymer transport system component
MSEGPSISKRTFFAVAAAIAAVVFAIPAIQHWSERPPAPPPAPQPVRAAWLPPEHLAVGAGGDYAFGLALAPDGRRLVYPAAMAGVVSLWLHDLRSGESRPVPGTEGAAMPFWSSDGATIGFFDGGHVSAIKIGDANKTVLSPASAGRGAAWSNAGVLIFAPTASGGLMRMDTGGFVAPFTTLDTAAGETAHTWPAFLADGRHVIFLVSSPQPSRAGIWIAALDAPTQRRRLIASDTQAIVADDHLLYLRDRTLMAQPLDATTVEASGRATAVGVNAGHGPIGQLFATAAADALIYGAPGTSLRELRWLSRDGQQAGPTSEPIDAWDMRLAPDGRRVVITEVDRQLRTLDVFIRNGSQPAPLRLSLSTDVDESGVWSPDGLRIAWAGQRRKIMLRGAGAVLPEQTVAAFDTPVQVWDWSRDGRSLLIGQKHADTGDDLWIQPPAEGSAAQPYATAAFDQTYGAFSPDGRSIAYASNESGQFDIYLDSYPKPGSRVRITTAGGTEPRWSADGRELFFRRGAEIHAVTMRGFDVQSITRLFDAGAPIRSFDVSRDGRFLINTPAASAGSRAATLVHHWRPTQNHGTTEAQNKSQ